MTVSGVQDGSAGERLREVLATHPVHEVPPVGDPYILGRWHKDRASAKGYIKEALAVVSGRVGRGRPAKLLVFGRPRSGTTLLGHLLGQLPDIHDDRECLHHAVLAPHRFLDNRIRGCNARAYVCKLLSYQMFEVQRIPDPLAFFERLAERGFLFIHLRRRSRDQALSSRVAPGAEEPARAAAVRAVVKTPQAAGPRRVSYPPAAARRSACPE